MSVRLYFQTQGGNVWRARPFGWSLQFTITKEGVPSRFVGRYGDQVIGTHYLWADALASIQQWAYHNKNRKE